MRTESPSGYKTDANIDLDFSPNPTFRTYASGRILRVFVLAQRFRFDGAISTKSADQPLGLAERGERRKLFGVLRGWWKRPFDRHYRQEQPFLQVWKRIEPKVLMEFARLIVFGIRHDFGLDDRFVHRRVEPPITPRWQ
jgi:hypothetical protein